MAQSGKSARRKKGKGTIKQPPVWLCLFICCSCSRRKTKLGQVLHGCCRHTSTPFDGTFATAGSSFLARSHGQTFTFVLSQTGINKPWKVQPFCAHRWLLWHPPTHWFCDYWVVRCTSLYTNDSDFISSTCVIIFIISVFTYCSN